MIIPFRSHAVKTARFAKLLTRPKLYAWLVTKGYFPEPYVLPPCFAVTKFPKYGKRYFKHSKSSYKPKITDLQDVHFPKTDLADRTFGIMDPEIHSDIAHIITSNWKHFLKSIFHTDIKVCCYSFPVPIDVRSPGDIGKLRSGRMIYEYIEMTENDVASEAYKYKVLIKTDIKNFYASIYTHSIPWALHGKRFIRKGANRYDHSLYGNRLDKLFQNANDGCTNGIPVGPVVSDLISELVLSGVDRLLSKSLDVDVTVVRFKDDYWILGKTDDAARNTLKELQRSLKEYKLQLNEEKTKVYELPDGIFRRWVSEYHAINPNPKRFYSFKRFKEVCLSVINIDRKDPGTGIIDRFLSDITTRHHKLRVELSKKTLPKVISLLLMLGKARVKAFPRVLAIIEQILKTPFGFHHEEDIASYLGSLLAELCRRKSDNRYLIMWVVYFARANKLHSALKGRYKFVDPIVRATYTSRFNLFKSASDFSVFESVAKSSKRITMLKHLDVFRPQ